MPFPFGLWVYNAFVNQEREGRQVDLQQAGVETGADHTVNPEVRVKVARNLLNEYGYFKDETSFEVVSRSQESPEGEAGI